MPDGEDVEPLGDLEREAIAQAPQYDEELKKQLGLATTENVDKSLLDLITLPSLNINGFGSGDIGALARGISSLRLLLLFWICDS